MNRRGFLGVLGGAALCLCVIGPGMVAASQRRLDANALKMQLHTTNRNQEAYIDRIVRMRDDGQLPDSILYGAYHHAVQQHRNRFPHFVMALETLARRSRIPLPPAPR